MKHKRNPTVRGRRHHRPKPGSPPGTLTPHHSGDTKVNVIAYNADRSESWTDVALGQLKLKADGFDVVWVSVVGLADISLIEVLGRQFGIHQLTLEDIVNVHQLAKFEPFNDYDYFVTRMASFVDAADSRSIETVQLSILRKGNFVFTFQQTERDCLGPLRRRIHEKSGLICDRGTDHLVYALIDSVIDHYFPLVDRLSDEVADFDEALLTEDSVISVRGIHQLRRELLKLSRIVRPHREMIGRLLREPSSFKDQTRVFLSDCFDHTLQLSESIDLNREVCSDLRSYHLELISNRTNEVMKTLTIVSTIFIPLSFIAGLYGMNFEQMPELKWKYGYPMAIASMVAVVLSLLFWFRKRGWFKTS